MKRLILALALILMMNAASAQPRAVVFQPVGTTGNLLTSESRDHWTKVAQKLKKADKASERVSQSLGLPPVNAIQALAAAKAAAPEIVQKAVEREKTVLLIPDRRRGGLMLNGETSP